MRDLSIIDEDIIIAFKVGLDHKRNGNIAFSKTEFDIAIVHYLSAFDGFKVKFVQSNIENIYFDWLTNIAICNFAGSKYFKSLKILD